ncbi:hypothetical protein K466DRAFT_618635 [Polyporus arcularius HHB13444]|uniref:DUF6533 domain-containing protein n=1 Tax=Polyporus arcularius HHB13444 TaxID=1314778 RepID=A0A5C3PL96_9APHY|nr:hypothetical protein K466DRAFT_618635 [Polyporus arcularius HHB13444]
MVALIFYEHLLTFGDEVEMFWKRKFTGATAIFLLNRYLILVSYLMELATVWIKSDNVSTQSCAVVIRTNDVFYYAIYIPWAAFGALRAYALTNRNWPLAIFVFLLSLVPYGMDMAQYAVGLTGVVDSAWGCNTAIPDSLLYLHLTPVTIAARATHIASDVILIGVTWYSLRRRTKGISKSSLTSIMYRNGELHAMLSISLDGNPQLVRHVVLHRLCSTVRARRPASSTFSSLTPGSRLTVILVSNFLLDLQRASCRSVDLGSPSLSHSDTDAHTSSTLVFDRRVIGSMGASLQPDVDAVDSDEGTTSEATDFNGSLGAGSSSGTHLD